MCPEKKGRILSLLGRRTTRYATAYSSSNKMLRQPSNVRQKVSLVGWRIPGLVCQRDNEIILIQSDRLTVSRLLGIARWLRGLTAIRCPMCGAHGLQFVSLNASQGTSTAIFSTFCYFTLFPLLETRFFFFQCTTFLSTFRTERMTTIIYETILRGQFITRLLFPYLTRISTGKRRSDHSDV